MYPIDQGDIVGIKRSEAVIRVYVPGPMYYFSCIRTLVVQVVVSKRDVHVVTLALKKDKAKHY